MEVDDTSFFSFYPHYRRCFEERFARGPGRGVCEPYVNCVRTMRERCVNRGRECREKQRKSEAEETEGAEGKALIVSVDATR